MELRNYVEQTLCDIFDGLVDAQEYYRSNGGVINPDRGIATLHQIEFDVEVRTSDVAGKKGGSGLFVGPIGVGASGHQEGSSSSAGRIKFVVPVYFPIGKQRVDKQRVD